MTALTTAPPAPSRRGTAWGRRATGAAVAAGLVALGLCVVLSLFVGSRNIDPSVVWQALTRPDSTDTAQLVITELRVPRTILAILVGVALGVAGSVMQALTRNPLAEPGILGVNAGAAAAAATGLAVTGGAWGMTGSFLFSFAGAAAASLLVAALGGVFGRGADPVRLTLAGAALAVTLAAYTNALLLNFPTVFDSFRHWAVGSVQGRGNELVLPALVLIVPAALVAVLLGRSFNAVALGHDAARALGASPQRVLVTGAVLIVLLAGTATAVAGPIGFVGLVAPLGVRMLVGPDYRRILPLSALAAAVLVLGADIIGRVALPPDELETSIVTALVGAPVFILLARRRRLMRL
ncbi:iron ABC transporter permease [Microbacterium horticulturae]|uniref:Iron ABC transporter permease n=1 Tax=Microbacterium horticulturae TaxID=3028316 RepID=A0ABY8BVQ1_9MICO|nr:iron ABC transporter permease [Microbacterium sp. KACC 23027]WEG08241.1 iron ABC transporter permease [Microbacterium sp. KACC 23027]